MALGGGGRLYKNSRKEKEEMEYFLNSFGDITIGNVAILLCAVIFLFGCYKKVEKYFSEKTWDSVRSLYLFLRDK